MSRMLMMAGCVLCVCAAARAEDGQYTPLYNGKNLDGWTPKFCTRAAGENYRDTFCVKDGLLTIDYSKWDKFRGEYGHLFYKTPYSHYRLRVTYRFIGEQLPDGPGWAWRNNGLMLHSQPPQAMAVDQEFPNSIEVQLLGNKRGPDERKIRHTANLCTPGTQVILWGKLFTPHCVSSKSKDFFGDGWVTVEVEVRGSESIRHIVDGEVVLEYTKPQLDDGTLLDKGYIAIQAESHATQFKTIEIMPLDD